MFYFKGFLLTLTQLFIFPKSFTDNITILRYVLLLFLGWRITLFLITFLGLSVFPNLDFFEKELFFPSDRLDYWNRWANWDSGAFLYIAQNGYIPNWTVFFPAYPILIRLFSFSGLSPFWSAFLISQVATLIFLFYLYKLIILDFNANIARRAIFTILIFPTSFYFVSVYSESLFLAAGISALYYARKKHWLLASVLAGLASSTRLIGLGVIVAIFIEYFLNSKPKVSLNYFWKSKVSRIAIYLVLVIFTLKLIHNLFLIWADYLISGVIVTVLEILTSVLIAVSLLVFIQLIKFSFKYINFKKIFSANFIYLGISVIPFITYLLYQQFEFNSYLTLIKSESSWGRTITFPWEGPLFSLKFLLLNPPTTTEFAAHIYVRLFIFTLTLVCLIIGYYKLRFSYIAFYLIAFMIPLFSGTIADFARYALGIFPMFIILGMIKNELIQRIGAISSLLLLSMLTILYFNSYFFI